MGIIFDEEKSRPHRPDRPTSCNRLDCLGRYDIFPASSRPALLMWATFGLLFFDVG
jgi:hypothetical protein